MTSYYNQVNGLAPKVWYRFDETAGTPTNSGSLSTTATFSALLLNENTDVDGRSVYFPATNSFIRMNAWPAFSLFDDKSFTIETWFKCANANDTGYLYRFSGASAASNTLSMLFLGGGDGRLRLDIAGLGEQTADKSTLTTGTYGDNNWHHVVVAVNTTSLKWYVDGNLISTKTLTTGTLNWDSYTSSSNNSRLIGVGRSNITDSLANYFKGWLDEFAIYGYELSAQNVLDNYNAGASVIFASGVIGTASALSLQPSITTDGIHNAVPMTANSLFANAQPSTVDLPKMVEKYLSEFSLEQWYKFDDPGIVTNYGTGGIVGSSMNFNGTAKNVMHGGIQGSGAFNVTNGPGYIIQSFGANEPYSTEITDNEFALGFWLKCDTNYNNRTILKYNNAFSGTNYYDVIITTNGNITFRSNGTQEAVATYGTAIDDNAWHFVYIEASASNNLIRISVDNSAFVTTTTNPSNRPNGINNFFIGNQGTNTNGEFSLSHYFVGAYGLMNSTARGNLLTYDNTVIQGSARMPMPLLKFSNKFNDLVASYNPKIEFRLDETSNSPTNFGQTGISISKVGTNVTYSEPTQNRFAYKFTNTDTYFSGDYTYSSGTFSTNNRQTMIAVFKTANTRNFEQIIGSMGMYGFLGSGITLAIQPTNGHLEARVNNGFAPSNTELVQYQTSVADNKWHLAVVVRDGSNLTLYLDGKQRAQKTNCVISLSDSATYGISAEAKFNDEYPETKDLWIDEFAVIADELSAQEVFELWQSLNIDGAFLVSNATFPMPTNIAGTGTTQIPAPQTASSQFVNPASSAETNITSGHLNAYSQFMHPNYEATSVLHVNYGAVVATANALFHEPQFQIGEVNSVGSFDASATMVHPIGIGVGNVSAPPAIALDATLVMPGIVTIKGARYFAEPMRSNAIFPLPPAYVQLTDDNWFNLLLAGHAERVIEPVQAQLSNLPNQATTDVAQGGFLSFFDDLLADRTPTTATNTVASEIPAFYFKRADSYTYDNNGNLIAPDTTKALARLTAARSSSDPAAILGSGGFDPYERKAARVNNIELPLPGTDIYYSQRPYNIEFSFKTTKQDQIVAYGKWNSFSGYARNIGVIGLVDGKIYLAEDAYKVFSPDPIVGLNDYRANIPATAPHPKNFVNRAQYLLGRKNVADGQWHHIIIQQGWTDGRTQIWVDGQLDRQIGVTAETGGGYSKFPGSDGTNTIRPYIIGFNSNDDLLYSDFETSGWNFYPARFITQDKILANFAAYSKWKPVKAEPMTATVRMTDNNAGKGNRPRALLLYWWENEERGKYGYWDEPTFPLSTADPKDQPPQQYYGWDIFPIDVIGRNQSDMIKEDVWMGYGYRDNVTGSPRYLDLMNDIDISKFDAIFFKNYPEQTPELDEYTRTEVADTYFGVQEKTLHENFLESLRKAMDTGISLYVTNAQLALDLGIIDRVEEVPDLAEDDFKLTDTFVVNKFANISAQQPLDSTGIYVDTWRNNRLRLVNTYEDITNYPTFLWRDWMLFENDDAINFGGINRPFISLLDRPNGLQVGDEFIISDAYKYDLSYQAVPFANVKAGTIITAFANTIDRNGVAIENPYKNYATSIAVSPGTILKGKPTVGKIFVNFTERITGTVSQITGDVSTPFIRPHWRSRDTHLVELIQDKWINQAYTDGSITLEKKNELLAAPANLDRQLEAAIAANNQSQINYINGLKYWDLNGVNIITNKGIINDPTGGGVEKDGLGDGVRKSIVNRTSRKGVVSTKTISSELQWFTITWAYENPTIQVKVPSILSNGFSWLADKVVDDGTVNRVEAMKANTATLPMPVVVGDKDRTVYAQAMFAGGMITNAVGYTPTAAAVASLPMFAEAKFGEFVKNIKPDVFTATAAFRQDIRTVGVEEDEIVIYMIHVDPILYLREDVIK